MKMIIEEFCVELGSIDASEFLKMPEFIPLYWFSIVLIYQFNCFTCVIVSSLWFTLCIWNEKI